MIHVRMYGSPPELSESLAHVDTPTTRHASPPHNLAVRALVLSAYFACKSTSSLHAVYQNIAAATLLLLDRCTRLIMHRHSQPRTKGMCTIICFEGKWNGGHPSALRLSLLSLLLCVMLPLPDPSRRPPGCAHSWARPLRHDCAGSTRVCCATHETGHTRHSPSVARGRRGREGLRGGCRARVG